MKQPIQNIHPKRHSKKKEKAYFASKSELLTWINTTLDLEVKGIEQTITGAIFCQLLDAAHPGTVRMNKVNWKAKLETEYISNFKIFQQGLSNNSIDKPINISRLSKGKTQELIELLQWLYGHHISLNIDPSNYNAIKKRNGQKFIFSGEKGNNINIISNKNIRDDLSLCSSSTEYGNNKMKNNLKRNINNLNINLRGDNFHTKYSYQNQNKNQEKSAIKNNKNKKNNEKSVHKNGDSHSIYSGHLSVSSNSDKIEENSNKNLNKNHLMSNSFIIDENPEENLNENEKVNNILFDGISNVEKDNILELEKNDGNNIQDLKILIRKLRVNNIVFKNNISTILNKVTKERNFYLNKLKDIEYLYFNPVIRNNNDNKNLLLKKILTSQIDSTVFINNEGFALIKEKDIFPSLPNYSKNEEINKINVESENINKNDNNKGNSRRNSLCIKFVYSKDNKNIIIKDNNSKEEQKLINKTQPDANQSNKDETKINELFEINNSILKNNRNKFRKKENVTPTSKICYYDISSHILNESLNIPNTENENPNISNINLQ